MSRTICLTSEDRTLNSITLNAFGFRLNLVIKGTFCTVYSIDHQTLDLVYISQIEDSIGLAIDSSISDVIITGDFNLNTMNQTQFRKVEALCNQFNMTQCIDEPTHFTENSHSTIDLLFVTNKDSILTKSLFEPCLDL